NWEVCLISWQTAQGRYPLVEVLASNDIQLLEGGQLIAKYLVFRNTDSPASVSGYSAGLKSSSC
ncbi:MAG: hypothetical protein QXU46_02825, partial [Candidatus Bathyarchaeia archaeon]